jgi:protein-S-isoprenylcysteine O-methyltransferase Ste14
LTSIQGFFLGLVSGAFYGAIVLVAAGLAPGGTWLWAPGLWFLAGAALVSAIGSGWLASANPAALKVRMQSVYQGRARKQPLVDRLATTILAVTWFAWLVFMPLDVVWLKLLPPLPQWSGPVGGVLAIIGVAIMLAAMGENEFAAPTVLDQSDTGQRVVDTGPYGLVRHPLYSGALLMIPGIALALGSLSGIVAGVAMLAVFLPIRIAVEEGFLNKTLPGYTDYARRVRARLIPFLI